MTSRKSGQTSPSPSSRLRDKKVIMNEIVMSQTVTFLQTPLPPSERDVMVTSFMDNPRVEKFFRPPSASTEERERVREREAGQLDGPPSL